MARLIGPDMGSRAAFLPNGRPAPGKTGVVYADAAGSSVANIAAYQPGSPTVPGAVIAGSIVTVDSAGLLPLFWFPDGVDRLWVSVNSGPIVPIDADNNARLDAHLANHPGPTSVNEAPLSLQDPRVGAALNGTNEAAVVATAVGMLPAAGGEILVPPGVLGLGSEVTLPANVSLTGSGLTASSIRPAGGYTGRLLSTGAANRVSHLNFHGLGTSGTLLTVRGARTVLSQLYLQNAAGDGIEFTGASSALSAHAAKITDVNIIGCTGRGVFVNAFAYDQEFVNLWIGTCGVGVRVQNSDCFFANLHVWGCTGNGVEVRGDNNRFANVYLESNGSAGIDIFNAKSTRVVGGSLWNNGGHGANVSSANRTSLSGLAIYENNTNGVDGSNSLYCQVTGCQFHDAAVPARQDRPIVTSGTSDSWIITGNVMRTADHVVGANTLVGASNVVANNIV